MSLLKKGGYTSYVSTRSEDDSVIDHEIQNVSSSRVYIFGNDRAEEVGIEDGSVEMTELRPRSRNKRSYASTKIASKQSKKTETIDREIQPSDTIQSFSLQYGCTIAELKKVNNLYSDQDFYALTTIKIPVQPHGILTEVSDKKQKPPPLKIPGNQPSTSGADNENENDESDYDDMEPKGECVRTVSIRSALDSPNSFLQHMDNDLKLICKSTPLRKSNLDEVTRTLTINCINPIKLRKQQEKTLGAACGIGWKGVLVLVFIVGLVLPGFVAFLYLRKKYTDQDQSSGNS
ncbi:lysM and putative peptidoglycan-binding domain-containing protein 4-like [Stylophora pistillata]|uniref:LysM and putative peptidoglycan-binding domain-containing protein 4 n=1 Tax=Stylophora pistillata TaxID=50429 RepID=A0A2B4SNK3_STYPI|nr:lysM and putative peptidoglycan-binding domain-containing protein 4-like [Stylophora pistillata]PFX30946.1 LysM and putative peptidoglycan-binding domain-containing protein 4 [Stylophora pistillata]